jgi:hypothetical protein
MAYLVAFLIATALLGAYWYQNKNKRVVSINQQNQNNP